MGFKTTPMELAETACASVLANLDMQVRIGDTEFQEGKDIMGIVLHHA